MVYLSEDGYLFQCLMFKKVRVYTNMEIWKGVQKQVVIMIMQFAKISLVSGTNNVSLYKLCSNQISL